MLLTFRFCRDWEFRAMKIQAMEIIMPRTDAEIESCVHGHTRKWNPVSTDRRGNGILCPRTDAEMESCVHGQTRKWNPFPMLDLVA
jgi:hypothetical protein